MNLLISDDYTINFTICNNECIPRSMNTLGAFAASNEDIFINQILFLI